MLKLFTQRRFLNTSSVLLNKTTVAKASLVDPSTWKGLPSKDIFRLFRQRQVTLGTDYKRSKEELDALLSTSKETGVSSQNIRSIYYSEFPEATAHRLAGVSYTDDYSVHEFKYDDLPSPAQDLVHQHREQRFYNRLAAHELPLLVQYRQEYKRPNFKTHPVTYKYTTYIGEEHPNSRKVVLNVKTAEIPGLEPKELHKLRLLAKTRYDSTTDVLKMSSDNYPEPAQNARYLSNILQRLIKEAKNQEDSFSDIPLDTRHITARQLRKRKTNSNKFPMEWARPQDAPKETINPAKLLMETLK
ncbi:related to 37S ribosomal protein S24, mitochondrial [Saccharomycodes ludwigii]|uniref:Small ribosomal subunit protein mS35 n=1 Tax=Saccharomycodes ludwigii TaxID=36035 RepID=A0A376B7R3_9ASCO|nr:hypothetical protein SCDLUD_001847 [Saccharomycodes ludwigii]KAH3902036.1 hypothetical protein SCDLUD_001847 [Saccharomycodes ludwigii]SSD60736.1 related to 37S ribosomal protein S24, mitochondrial [Saccharomycodes ludwigii]